MEALEKNHILSSKIKYNKINSKPVVYFLIKNDEIVYIGITDNVDTRLRQHSNDKDFESYSFIEIEENERYLEDYYIIKFNPVLNSFLKSGYYISLQNLKNTMKKQYRENKSLYEIKRKFKELSFESFKFNGIVYYKKSDVLEVYNLDL